MEFCGVITRNMAGVLSPRYVELFDKHNTRQMNAHMIKHVTAYFHLGHFMLLFTACEIESNSAVVSVVMRSCEFQKINKAI